jgi:TPR repeat protein
LPPEEHRELQAAADSGDAEAQYKLAQVLNHGLGVRMDEDAALELYRSSAMQGFEPAQFTLGEICKEGRITPQDLIQAEMWYCVVADQGGVLAPAAHEARDILEPFMSPEQIAAAKKQAAGWSPSVNA